MRVFLIGVLSVTLIGCTCPTAPQAMLEACTSKACFYRTAASPPIELKPAPFKPNRTTTKVVSKKATKTAKTSSVAAKAQSKTLQNPLLKQATGLTKTKSPPRSQTPNSSAPPPQPVEQRKERCRNECERRGIGSGL